MIELTDDDRTEILRLLGTPYPQEPAMFYLAGLRAGLRVGLERAAKACAEVDFIANEGIATQLACEDAIRALIQPEPR